MDDLENRLTDIIQKVASKDNLFSFLKVMSDNINLSLENILLVYEQKPDAGVVCGKRAWEQIGRIINKEDVPIEVLFPEIREGQDVRKLRVRVYDIGSTAGKEICSVIKISFADRITEITGITWEIIPEDAFGESLELGRYDIERNVFYLSKACPKELEEQTILNMYLEYVMNRCGINDHLVKMAVLYVLYERWQMKNTIVSALFGRLGKMSPNEKICFLKKVCYLSRIMTDDMEGDSLSFNETAFINELLQGTEIEEMKQTFEQAGKYILDEEIRQELFQLEEKLERAGECFLKKLFSKKMKKSLFSYPPVYFEYQEHDYFRKERKLYYGEID